MTSVYTAASYLDRLIKRGMGGYKLTLGTRGMVSLRPQGRTLNLELPHLGDEIAGSHCPL